MDIISGVGRRQGKAALCARGRHRRGTAACRAGPSGEGAHTHPCTRYVQVDVCLLDACVYLICVSLDVCNRVCVYLIFVCGCV